MKGRASFRRHQTRGPLFESSPCITPQKLQCDYSDYNDESEDMEFQIWLQTQLKQSPLRDTFLRPSSKIEEDSADETRPTEAGAQPFESRTEAPPRGKGRAGRVQSAPSNCGTQENDCHDDCHNSLSCEVLKYVCVVVLAVVDGALLTAVLANNM